MYMVKKIKPPKIDLTGRIFGKKNKSPRFSKPDPRQIRGIQRSA
jgi:hypothetical protein